MGPFAPRVVRRHPARLDESETASQVLTPEAVFRRHVPVEGSRGCEWGAAPAPPASCTGPCAIAALSGCAPA
jgi:hypothetical protein